VSLDVVLSVHDLTIAFQRRTVIRGLSFKVFAGDTLAVIGPNGSGKTVLLKALLKIIPYRGEIIWKSGVRLGYVPQKVSADRQMPLLVRDLLEAQAQFLKLPNSQVRTVCKDVGITPELMNAGIGVISGGQFQKLLIASALLGDPQILLFDEPTASLDELEEERVYELLERLRRQRALTLLLVSHDLTLVHHAATSVLCLSTAAGPCFGTPDKILTPEVLATAFGASEQLYRHHHQFGEETQS